MAIKSNLSCDLNIDQCLACPDIEKTDIKQCIEDSFYTFKEIVLDASHQVKQRSLIVAPPFPLGTEQHNTTIIQLSIHISLFRFDTFCFFLRGNAHKDTF